MKRTIGVTLVAVVGYIAGTLTFIAAVFGLAMLGRDDAFYASLLAAWLWSPEFHVGRALLSGIVYVISGTFLLRGDRWARFLFLGWSWLQLLINVFTSPHFRGAWTVFAFAQLALTVALSYVLLTERDADGTDRGANGAVQAES